MRTMLRGLAVTAVLALAAVGLASPGQADPGQRHTPLTSSQATAMRAQVRSGTAGTDTEPLAICAQHQLACQALVLARKSDHKAITSVEPIGLGATELQKAYGLTSAPSTHDTIAIVDAGAYPSVGDDLDVYRAQYGLPACKRSTGCLTVRSYDGSAERAPGRSNLEKLIEELVSVETALDLDMASAACPSCKLLLLQTPPKDAIYGSKDRIARSTSHFATAVQTAKSLGAKAVSISYGYPSDKYDVLGTTAQHMDVPGIAVTASSGDDGFNGDAPPWPQVLPSVISVGGTALTETSSGAFHEAAWNAAGSGCSHGLTPAAFGQPAAISDLCDGSRASTDVSAVADPTTGVSVYNTYAPYSGESLGWISVGGTSASSPLVAGMYARAGVPSGVHGPNRLYAAPSSAFHDVVTGANAPRGVCTQDGADERVCTTDDGWDGPTGLGSPVGLAPFH